MEKGLKIYSFDLFGDPTQPPLPVHFLIYSIFQHTDFRRLLIDTGDANVPECMQNLKTVLTEEKATISNIILTHWHHDHIGGVRDVLQSLGSLNNIGNVEDVENLS